MQSFHHVFVPDHFMNCSEIMSLVRSTGAMVRTLCPIVSANRCGHVNSNDFFNGLAIDAKDALSTLAVVIEGDTDTCKEPSSGKTRIEMMGATIVIVPRSCKRNVDEIAKLLAPYGNFTAPTKDAA